MKTDRIFTVTICTLAILFADIVKLLPPFFYVFFEELKTECEEEFTSYSNKTKNIYKPIEFFE